MSLDQRHDYWSSKIGESVIGEWHEMTSDYELPVVGVRQIVNYGSNKVQFMNPIKPLDNIRSN
ncbi:MAG: hypothetical protein U9N31_03225 [Candidatus Marinimicrobia bacterium]|nr:hypothetical protein [Candidatus Neomarinimicrobiota bacterium]